MHPTEIDLPERFTQALVHLARRWRWCLDRRLRGTGLTPARWSALLQIARGGDGLAQRQLSDFMGIESATLVPILDFLGNQQLVERRADPLDRRSNTVHLTTKAEPVVGQIEKIAHSLRAELTQDISADDLATCIRVFAQVQARIPAAADPVKREPA